jgi:hypothetical protein
MDTLLSTNAVGHFTDVHNMDLPPLYSENCTESANNLTAGSITWKAFVSADMTSKPAATSVDASTLWQYQRGTAIVHYSSPFLMVMAAVGNIMSVIVLQHPTFRKSSTCWLKKNSRLAQPVLCDCQSFMRHPISTCDIRTTPIHELKARLNIKQFYLQYIYNSRMHAPETLRSTFRQDVINSLPLAISVATTSHSLSQTFTSSLVTRWPSSLVQNILDNEDAPNPKLTLSTASVSFM